MNVQNNKINKRAQYLIGISIFFFTANAFAMHPAVVHILKAEYLNTHKKLIADITKQVKVKDNVYAAIHDGEYVRVTFEQALDDHYDNSLYARPSNIKKPASIEVFPVYTDQKGRQTELQSIAVFPSINHEGFYKILLTKLQVPTNTFDLKVTGGVDIDYIVDPTYTILHNFLGDSYGFGQNPDAPLLLSGSTFYGTTVYGGAYDQGIIFSIATSGGTLTDLHDFSGVAQDYIIGSSDGAEPVGPLTISGSTLYGTTSQGGVLYGIIYSIATSGGALTILHTFSGSDGTEPETGLVLSGSTLYGTNLFGGANDEGILFSIATSGGPLTDLYDFTGSALPIDPLIISGSTLYGMSAYSGLYSTGMIFSIPTTGGAITDLHDFSGSTTDGGTPYFNNLVLSGSTLYGMTEQGGLNGEGIIFSMAKTGGTLTDLHDFSGSTTDGENPANFLTLTGTTLYGMTGLGGLYGDGIIFSMATSGGTLTDLHDFSGSTTDGDNSSDSSLIFSGGTMYSMTFYGGGDGQGILFSIANTGGTLTDLYNFNETAVDGSAPRGSFVLSGSNLYGMTNSGGVYNYGMIFSMATSGGTLTDLHDFSDSSTDGGYPVASLTLSGSTLYGMTNNGGGGGYGIVFSIATSGGTLTDLHDLSGTVFHQGPDGSLTLSGSTLYGMDRQDEINDGGIVFSIATTGGTLTELHHFSFAPDGGDPSGDLIVSGSTMYGMTELGGANGIGFIFSMATSGGALTDLHDFSGSSTDGQYPQGDLTLSGSTLYGMAYEGGAYSDGIIFSIATSGGALTDLHDFSGSATDGLNPYSTLCLAGNILYGMTPYGGLYGYGVAFTIATSGGTLTDIHDFSQSATDGIFPQDSLIY